MSSWNKAPFPFQADYNDHFETPKQSYLDILPVLDAIGLSLSLTRSGLILYDPFYCNGLAKANLESLGFSHVIHERRDFYEDVRKKMVPFHHVLITNPPYSEDHKERIVEYAMKRLRAEHIPFFLLMPNYVATKLNLTNRQEYFRKAIIQNDGGKEDPADILYILPATKYQYHHPEGTGKEESPFDSIWYCGVPQYIAASAIDSFERNHRMKRDTFPVLARTLDDLKLSNAVPTGRRRNPKQRRKEKARHVQEKPCADESAILESKLTKAVQDSSHCVSQRNEVTPNRKSKLSIYRDEKGIRKKRRF